MAGDGWNWEKEWERGWRKGVGDVGEGTEGEGVGGQHRSRGGGWS